MNTGFRPEDREHELKVVRTKPDDKNRPMTVSTADIEPGGALNEWRIKIPANCGDGQFWVELADQLHSCTSVVKELQVKSCPCSSCGTLGKCEPRGECVDVSLGLGRTPSGGAKAPVRFALDRTDELPDVSSQSAPDGRMDVVKSGGVMACVHRAGAWCRADNAAYVGGVRGACGLGVFSVGEDEGSVGEPPMRYDIDTLTDNRVYCPRCFRVGVFHTRVVYTVPARKATLNRIFQVMNGMLVKREGYCGLSRSDHARKTLCGVCCSRFHELDRVGRRDNAGKAVRTQG